MERKAICGKEGWVQQVQAECDLGMNGQSDQLFSYCGG